MQFLKAGEPTYVNLKDYSIPQCKKQVVELNSKIALLLGWIFIYS